MGLCRQLLSRDCPVLRYLGKRIPYEIAVGLNGRFWINSENAKHVILISNAIQRSEGLSEDQVEEMVSKTIDAADL